MPQQARRAFVAPDHFGPLPAEHEHGQAWVAAAGALGEGEGGRGDGGDADAAGLAHFFDRVEALAQHADQQHLVRLIGDDLAGVVEDHLAAVTDGQAFGLQAEHGARLLLGGGREFFFDRDQPLGGDSDDGAGIGELVFSQERRQRGAGGLGLVEGEVGGWGEGGDAPNDALTAADREFRARERAVAERDA